jgi:uncharacterized Tic20 family protein
MVKKSTKGRKLQKKSSNSRSKKISKSPTLRYSTKKKINLVFRNLIYFLILFIVSFIFYFLSKGGIYEDLFFLISFILGVVTFLFLLILLVFLFMRGIKK